MTDEQRELAKAVRYCHVCGFSYQEGTDHLCNKKVSEMTGGELAELIVRLTNKSI
jgi:hypothetical protein